MDWLQNLLFDENSIAHIVLLYSFVIAVGVLLGKIKFFGVSLGVTFVLFTGIVCGHFGLTGNTQILTFLQDFGLILFVYRAQNEAYKKVDGEKRRKTLLIKELCVMAASGHAKRNVYMGLHCV